VAVTASSTPKSSVTPSDDRLPETSEKDNSKGLTNKRKDDWMNPKLPEKTVATATPESIKHLPEATHSATATPELQNIPPKAIHSAYPKCSWSISSMGCLLPAVEPKDICGVKGFQLVLHLMCQIEWESYQYHLECPNGDPSLSKYDSGGKKRCIHHHPQSKLAIQTVPPSTADAGIDNSTTTTLVASKGSSHASVDKIIGKESDAKDMGIHCVTEQKQLSVLKSTTTKDLYPRAIQEIYPGINTGWMSINLTFYENWAQVRATAALKAFITVKTMITEKKIKYDNRASLSDD
jgi:hypothetical protein